MESEPRAVPCRVIHKDTATDLIVHVEAGNRQEFATSPPGVTVGSRGLLLETQSGKVFIREPYGGSMSDER